MSKDKEKQDWFRGIDINPFRFKRDRYLPFFDESADYNTNSKSYYDYLARINRILEVMKHFIIRLLDRDVKTKDTPTVSLKKEGDWIDNGEGNPPNNYDDDITLSANVKRSSGKETLILNENTYEVGNALSEKEDGLFSPDYTELLEEFEAGGGGTELDYSGQTEIRTYTNIQDTPFNISNGSKNKGGEEIHELWSPDYDNVLKVIDLRIGEINDLVDGINDRVDDVIENPPEYDFGYVHDTFLPKTNFYYNYHALDSIDTQLRPQFIFQLSSNFVNLSPGNQDIVVSFTPEIIHPENYEIEEVVFLAFNSTYSNIRDFEKGSYRIEETFGSQGGLVNGKRYHIRLATNFSDEKFQLGKAGRIFSVYPTIKNKHSGTSFTGWEIDGEKPTPLTAEDRENMEVMLRDVEVRVVNQ